MKAFRIPIFMLLVVPILCFFVGSRVAQCSGDWQAQVQQVTDAAAQSDWAEAERCLLSLDESWQAQQSWLHMVIEHRELDETEALLRRCIALSRQGEGSELTAELAELQSQFELLDEMQRLTLRNIL